MQRTSVPTRLIRFVSFDGANLSFFDNMDPTRHETLPLGPNYHAIAAQLQQAGQPKLCKATVEDGVITWLSPTRTHTP